MPAFSHLEDIGVALGIIDKLMVGQMLQAIEMSVAV